MSLYFSFSLSSCFFSSDDDSVRGSFSQRCSAFLPSITFTLHYLCNSFSIGARCFISARFSGTGWRALAADWVTNYVHFSHFSPMIFLLCFTTNEENKLPIHTHALSHTHSLSTHWHTHMPPLNDEIPRKALTTLGSSSPSSTAFASAACASVCVWERERDGYLCWCAFRHNFCVGQPSTFDFLATFHT